jgi:GTP cyclohydrolase II
MINLLVETNLSTQFGLFRLLLYTDGLIEIPVLVMGNVSGAELVILRMHSTCINGHYFNSTECDCMAQMTAAQAQIQTAGSGIIILLNQEGKGNGYLGLLKSKPFKEQGMPQPQAYIAAGYPADARDYTIAADILRDLGVRSVSLITENVDKIEQLRGLGVVVERA